ncbi:hypothetical protein F5884DRAFT_863249 [Xylogone sp. PMI_703]|nr:hypothetical protein F5884DRAFT_863249 [Xylogone sp. PMI_703]
MADFGFSADTGISPIAVWGPFQLFSESAIKKMRRELLGQPLPNCQVNIEGVGRHMRGMVPSYANFTHKLWTHPATLTHISKIAGLRLIPAMDIEISQVNVLYPKKKATSGIDWHRSSFPFVCVMMLSNMEGTKGGETCFRGPSREVKKLDTFPMGSVYLLQGLHVEHMVCPFVAEKNRVTVITSFRPFSPYVRDASTIAAIRSISDPGRLYSEFCEYRLRNIHILLIQVSTLFQKKTDPRSINIQIQAIAQILQSTCDELVEEIRAPEDTGPWTPEEIVLYAAKRFKTKEEELHQNRCKNMEEEYGYRNLKFDTDQMIRFLGGMKNFLLHSMDKPISSWL